MRILAQAKDIKLVHSYLEQAHDQIVKPMNARLRQLMLEMNFGCEGEIFGSDLTFKMYDDSSCERFKAFAPMSTEDLMGCLKARLNKIVQNFQSKFNELLANLQYQ